MGQITLKVYRNTNRYSRAYQKYYGRVKANSIIDVETLCAHAAQDSGIEESDVHTVFDALFKQIKEQLCNGHPIKFDRLGTLKIGIKSDGLSTEDAVKRGFQPDDPKDDIRKYMNAGTLVKCTYLLFNPTAEVKTELNTIKFETDKSEWADVIKKEKEAA